MVSVLRDTLLKDTNLFCKNIFLCTEKFTLFLFLTA